LDKKRSGLMRELLIASLGLPLPDPVPQADQKHNLKAVSVHVPPALLAALDARALALGKKRTPLLRELLAEALGL
jgi:hypothetical protein